jgi:hypothetical protein
MGMPRRLVDVSPGEEISGFDFSVPVPGSISGLIQNDDGQPVPGARAAALHYVPGIGLVPVQGPEAVADERGAYRIHSLPLGRYAVRASGPRVTQVFGGAKDTRKASLYRPTLYPDADSAAKAAFVTVRAGLETNGVNHRLLPVEPRIIRGEAVTSPAAILTGKLKVTLEDPELQFRQTVLLLGRPQFAFENLPAGRYRIILHGQDENGVSQSAFQDVDVTKQDATDVTLTPQGGVWVDGSIRVVPDGAGLTDFRPTLYPSFAGPFAASLRADVDAKLRFRVGPAAPGPHVVRLEGLPAHCYEDRILASAREAQRGEVVVEAGLNLQVDVVCEAAAINGIIRRPDKRPAPGSVVVARRLGGSEDVFFDRDTDQKGEFRITGLRPGKYQLIAFDSFDPSCLADPFCMEPHRSSGVTVEVGKKESKSVDLFVIAFQP